MKIAIYGDSYAAHFVNARKEIHWFNILGNLLNANIINFAKTGSSLYFSYNNFLTNYEKYDYNIFLVTNPFRYTKQVIIKNCEEHIHNIDAIDILLNRYNNIDKVLDNSEIEFLENLRSWFLVSDDKYMKSMHDLMIEDILRKHSNVIMYPCFRNSMIGKNYDSFMFNWTLRCHEFFDIKFENYSDETFNMACHMTEEINIKFAEAMRDHIVTGKEIIMPKYIEHKHDLEYYYKRK